MNSLDLHGSETPSAARRLLFRDTAGNESASDIVQWWEKRRIPFNIAVGTTGLVSLTFLGVLGSIGPESHTFPGSPFLPVLFFGVLANLAYTAGWGIELLLLRPLFGRQAGTVGATLFRYGLAFSVGLTAIPIPMAILEFGFRMLRWIF